MKMYLKRLYWNNIKTQYSTRISSSVDVSSVEENNCQSITKISYIYENRYKCNAFSHTLGTIIMNSTLKISSVAEYIETIIKFPNFRFARGESKAYETPFLPSIWRPDNKHIDKTPISESSNYTIGELDLLREFQQKVISGDIRDPYFPVFIEDINGEIPINSENLWHWTSFAQHYGTQTRLADVTGDSLAALYFACEKNFDDNGYVHIFKDNFNTVDRGNLGLVNFGDSFFDVLEIKDDENDKHPRTPNGDTTTLIVPTFPNRRIEAQRGSFCFTRDINIAAYWGGQLSLEVLAENDTKQQILTEMKRLGYTENSIYPPEY